MKTKKSSIPCVLVTGIGGIIGQGVISSLKMTSAPVKIIGLEKNPDALAAKDCDKFYIKPKTEDSSEYNRFLKRLVVGESVDLIIPCIDQDICYFNSNRSLFRELEVKIVLNNQQLIDISNDKWKTHQALLKANIKAIPTAINGCWEECIDNIGTPPLLLKPRTGSGSKGIVNIEDVQDFEYWKQKLGSQFMVQRIVGNNDEEYTAGVFGFGDGSASSAIIFKRKLGANGATWLAETVKDLSIQSAIETLNKAFKPYGPTNYQFRKEGSDIYLLEVNPRISSSTSIRAAFGFNEAWACIDYFLNNKLPLLDINMREGKAERYIKDYIEYI